MTIHSFVDRFAQLFSWLYYRHQWEVWELLAATGAVLLLLLSWVAKKQRDDRKARAWEHAIRQSSPIIGVKLAAGNHHLADVTDAKRPRLPFLAWKKNGEPNETEPLMSAVANTRPPQHETIKCQRTQAGLDQQLDELKATNEKLQSQINHSKKTEQQLRRRMARLLVAGKKMRQERGRLERAEEAIQRQPNPSASQRFGSNSAGPMQARKHPAWSPLELLATNRLSRCRLHPQGQDEEMLAVNPNQPPGSRRANQPLDVEKLKAIAALAKQIQSRPRRA